LKSQKYHIGRSIVTKAVGKDDDHGNSDIENITDLYKSAEGCEEERLAVMRAAQSFGVYQIFDVPEEDTDVEFDLIELDQVMIGKPFSVTVNVENKSNEMRNVVAVLSASSVYYTGILAKSIKKEQQFFKLQPRQKEVLSITVHPQEYIDKLVDHNFIKIYGMATIKETNQTWCEEDDFTLMKPEISLQAEGALKVDKEFPLKIEFTNPLAVTLTDSELHIEGPTLAKPRTIHCKDIMPGAIMTHIEKFTPTVEGNKKLIATFTSRQLSDVSSSETFFINP
jgi:transglutaminase 1